MKAEIKKTGDNMFYMFIEPESASEELAASTLFKDKGSIGDKIIVCKYQPHITEVKL